MCPEINKNVFIHNRFIYLNVVRKFFVVALDMTPETLTQMFLNIRAIVFNREQDKKDGKELTNWENLSYFQIPKFVYLPKVSNLKINFVLSAISFSSRHLTTGVILEHFDILDKNDANYTKNV